MQNRYIDFSRYHPVVEQIALTLEHEGCMSRMYEHEAVRTSEEAAAVRPEYSLAEGSKALIVCIKKKNVLKKDEKEFVQIVVSGDKKFDPKKVRTVLHAKDIRFARSQEMYAITGGVEPGGVPPFGNIFGLRVVADTGIFEHREIIFSAGDRSVSIAILTEDYKHIVQPIVEEIV